jgi:hypothetical protein
MEMHTQTVLYFSLVVVIYTGLMLFSKRQMQKEVRYRVWVYNIYELPCTPIKPTGEVILYKFIPVLLTGWALPLLYLAYTYSKRLYGRY